MAHPIQVPPQMKNTLDLRSAWSGLTRYGVMTVKMQFQSYHVS